MKWEAAAELSVYGIAVKRKVKQEREGVSHQGYLVRHRDGRIWKSMWKDQMLVKVNGLKGQGLNEGWRPLGMLLGKGLVAERCKEEDKNISEMLKSLGVVMESNNAKVIGSGLVASRRECSHSNDVSKC